MIIQSAKNRRTTFVRLILFIFFLTGFVIIISPVSAVHNNKSAFPQKPITLIVHSKAGSGIDLMCRKISAISVNSKYCSRPIVVENHTGGGGNIAMQKVNDKKADGYTMLAVTKSFISTSLLSNNNISLQDFDLLACMVSDSECLIVNTASKIKSFADLKKSAQQKKGKQKWIGPFVGGTDHLMAIKTMLKTNTTARWIPYDTGSEAIAGIMGNHEAVYIGNPGDTKGRPVLKIIAVASEQRLEEFSSVPTFKELGYDLVEDLWRGIAIKAGTPLNTRKYLLTLLQKISNNPEWQKFISSSAARPVFITGKPLIDKIKTEQTEAKQGLMHAGIISESKNKTNKNFTPSPWASLIPVTILGIFFYFKYPDFSSTGALGFFFLGLAGFFYTMTLTFPAGKLNASVGPASTPKMWSYLIFIFAGILCAKEFSNIFKHNHNTQQQDKSKCLSSGVKIVIAYCIAMAIYIFALDKIGYFAATLIAMPLAIHFLGFKNKILIVIVTIAYLLFAWITFTKALGVPLP